MSKRLTYSPEFDATDTMEADSQRSKKLHWIAQGRFRSTQGITPATFSGSSTSLPPSPSDDCCSTCFQSWYSCSP